MLELSIGLLENRVFEITCMDQVMQILTLVAIICITQNRFFTLLVPLSSGVNHGCLTDSHYDSLLFLCRLWSLPLFVLHLVLLPFVDLCQVSCNDHKGIVESNKADEDANVPMAIGEIVAVLQVLETMY